MPLVDDAEFAALRAANAALQRQLDAATAQSAAGAEVMQLIGVAPGDAEATLRGIAEITQRLFAASSVTLLLADGANWGQALRAGAGSERIAGTVPQAHLGAITPQYLPGAVYLENRQIHLPDLDDPATIARWPGVTPARAAGVRATVGTPLRREGRAIGALVVHRDLALPFSAAELALLQGFADQAAIAAGNARLVVETREALDRQTATADILKVIARSSTDVQPVLDAIAGAANRLVGGYVSMVLSIADDMVHLSAFTGTTPETDAALRIFYPKPLAMFSWAPAIRRGEVHLVEDTEIELAHDAVSLEIVRKRGWRSAAYVPLLREGRTIGTIAVTRAEPGRFAEREVALLKTFADQAVIATENAGLLHDLQRSLQQQTAVGDVLKSISRSAFDLQPILDTLVQTAARLCDTEMVFLLRREGDVYKAGAAVGFAENYIEFLRQHPIHPNRGTVTGRVALSHKTVEILDVTADPDYTMPESTTLGGQRTALGVPLLREDDLIGVIVLARQRVQAFTREQIELVTTFADQAVIAIENARLFDQVQARTRDLSESLQQQTAVGDVLKVISRSGYDLQAIFDTVLSSAVKLIGASGGSICVRDGEVFPFRAVAGGSAVFTQHMLSHPAVPGRGSTSARTLLTGDVVVIPDMLKDPDYALAGASLQNLHRSGLGVPLLRDGRVEGAIALVRSEPGTFDSRQIEVVKTFADQAVIAIENTRLFNETKDALERQTATADILKVIASSPADVQPVFDAVVLTAYRLFGREFAAVMLCGDDGTTFWPRAVSGRGELIPILNPAPTKVDPEANFPSRAIVSQKNFQVPDWSAIALPDYERGIREMYGINSALYLPMLRGAECIGVLLLGGSQPGTFNEADIALAESFRDQALIAIENTRLFNETKEALEQQKASADVLGVISKSVAAAQPVFDEILSSIERLFSSEDHAIYLARDEMLHIAAIRGPRAERAQALFPVPLDGTASAIAIRERRLLRSANVFDDPALPLATRERYRALGANYSMAVAPLLSNDGAIGSIMVTRTSMAPFTDKECALLRTFADQAVIAIENARLFEQVQAKTRELTESLQQQTATADVLKVISRSAFDLEAVFETVVERSARLTGVEAARANIFRYDGEFLRISATYNVPPDVKQWLEQNPIRPGRHSGTARAALERRTIHVPDVLADPEYTYGAKAIEPYRTILGVPIIKANDLLGVLLIYLLEVKPFDDKQISLVETFADQAGIAIENTRLFNETKEALERQTATADVLKVISRSAFDLQNVFNTLLDSAARLVGASNGALCVRDGDVYPYRATIRNDPEWSAYLQAHPARAGRHSISGRVILSGEVETIVDVRRDPEYDQSYWLEGHTSMIGVPLLRSGQVEGVFSLARSVAGGYAQGEIDLMRTFADQAVIAIENTRLFDQVQARTRELTQSLDNLRAAQDRLVQTEKLASLGQLTAGIAHEIKNPLNFVNNFAALSADLTDELQEVLDKATVAAALRAEIDEIAALLKSNLEKVVQHGMRADSIVRNMLLHSREGSGEHRPTDVNALVEESLNLAYHGARAETPQFNVTLARDLDPAAGLIEAFPQEITRVLLNLIGNGFYAMAKRSGANGAGYEPVLNAATRDCGDHVEIRIRDNGTGIPAEVKEKMFNPFFTTKPAGEGTGLGLSMSHDIVVKQHGGSIDVDTAPGAFTEFVIRLPRQSRSGG